MWNEFLYFFTSNNRFQIVFVYYKIHEQFRGRIFRVKMSFSCFQIRLANIISDIFERELFDFQLWNNQSAGIIDRETGDFFVVFDFAVFVDELRDFDASGFIFLDPAQLLNIF